MQSKRILSFGLLALSLLSTAAGAQTSSVTSEKRSEHPSFQPDSFIVGARLGLFNVETVDDTVFGYGAFADYAIGTNFLAGGTLDYWSRTSALVQEDRVQINDLALGANGKIVFTNVTTPFRPYALAGLAIHRFQLKKGTTGGEGLDKLKTHTENDSGKLGIDLGGGMMYRVQQAVDVAGEIRWRRLTDTAAELDQIAFTGGVSYAL